MSQHPTPHTPMISGPGIAEGSEVHAQLDRRVSNMESWAENLSESIGRVENEARAGQARLEGKLDDQTALLGAKIDSMATRHLAGQRTNWGVIASWVTVGVVIVGAIGLSYTRPLQQSTEADGRRLDKLEDRERADFERGIRNEERIIALRERVDRVPTPGKGGTP